MSYNPISYINLIGASGTINKANLTTATTQNLHGYGIKFTAGSNLLCGQPVIYNYASGVVTAISAGALPSQHEYIGIALQTVSIGGIVEVATQGLATARRDTTFTPDPSAETVLLNNITNGTIRNLTNDTSFLDSGDSGADYGSNENYQITFDAQAGYTANIIVNNIAFETLGSSGQYDRLGVQGSNDGVSFVNLSVSWLQSMANTTFPYGNSFAGSIWSSAASKNGWVFPGDNLRATTLGSGGIPSTAINTGYRYIKFLFYSDSSSNELGWDMTLAPNTVYPSSTEATVSEGTTLYLDNSDFTKITTDDTSQIVVGYCAYDDASNNSIFIRV